MSILWRLARHNRQEMLIRDANSLKIFDKLPSSIWGKMLTDFKDNGNVASRTTNAMIALVKARLVSGGGGKLNPTGPTTRAGMAQVL